MCPLLYLLCKKIKKSNLQANNDEDTGFLQAVVTNDTMHFLWMEGVEVGATNPGCCGPRCHRSQPCNNLPRLVFVCQPCSCA